MIFRPIPKLTVEDNAKYEAKTEGSKGTYTVTVVVDEFDDNKLVLRNLNPEEEYREHTNCTCPGFRKKKIVMCKHIRVFIHHLKASGVEIDTEGYNVSE